MDLLVSYSRYKTAGAKLVIIPFDSQDRNRTNWPVHKKIMEYSNCDYVNRMCKLSGKKESNEEKSSNLNLLNAIKIDGVNMNMEIDIWTTATKHITFKMAQEIESKHKKKLIQCKPGKRQFHRSNKPDAKSATNFSVRTFSKNKIRAKRYIQSFFHL